MFGDGPLTFREAVSREPWPLATVHDAILFEFLPGRDDAVLCGAHAVNAYVEESRMTQDVDVVSPCAEELAEAFRLFLAERFPFALCVRRLRDGMGYRIFQVREPTNRHLVDVRRIDVLPPNQRVQDVLVLAPPELICQKVLSMVGRAKSPKSYSDQADLYRLLLTSPDLKAEQGPVLERLRAAGASRAALAAWKDLVAQEIQPEDEDAEFGG